VILCEPGEAAAAVTVEVDEALEVGGSRTSLSPADVRSAMPRLPTTPSEGQWAGAGRRGRNLKAQAQRGSGSWLLR
jgi:hypothetical protein